MDRDLVRASKFLSWVLRHEPEKIGLTLAHGGWASVPELLQLAAAAGEKISEAELRRAVAENDKQRFALTSDGAWIRANQGHSIAVDLGLTSRQPPELLFHGTAERNLASIRREGLLPGKRQHVHLSTDRTTAMKVGSRHGDAIVLEVRSLAMHEAGRTFFLSANGVWLTDHVPAMYLIFSRSKSQ